ncbi:MAG: hypothetical protein GX146_07135 [Myxococcales bacterium]|nr:hypothetical protein [Myxococcales bacterium]
MPPKPRPQLLFIGADGLDPHLLARFADQGHLPHLAALQSRGTLAPLRSTLPPVTFPAWTSAYTGTTPDHHGVTDFTVREGYRVRFIGAHERRGTTWPEHLTAAGLTVGMAWFPVTWPPLPLAGGYHISGWDSPVDVRGDASFVHPPDLHRALQRAFGAHHLAFDSLDEFSNDAAWFAHAAQALPRRLAQRAEMAQWLLAHRPVDVAAFYFGETDTVAHHFWAHGDPDSPRRPRRIPPGTEDAILRVYQSLDAAVGKLAAKVGPDTPILIASDHGVQGNAALRVHLNHFLAQCGLLRFRAPQHRLPLPQQLPLHRLRHALPHAVPRAWRRHLFNLWDRKGPGLVESRIRFGHIDFAHTLAFSEELPYAPAIWFNQRGRDPQGQLPATERRALYERICEAARGFTLDDGTPVIQRIHRREDLGDGPFITRIPDLVLELATPGGYALTCAPSLNQDTPLLTRLDPNTAGSRKGQSLPGGHRRDGVWLTNANIHTGDPRVSIDAATPLHIHHVPALICRALGCAPAPSFAQPNDAPTPAPDTVPLAPPTAPAYTDAEARIVAARLARLGYLEE